MDGFLDENNAAFLTLDIGQGPLDFLIDTGFSGTLIVGEEFFDESNARRLGHTDAELVGDQWQKFRSYEVIFRWLGEDALVQVLVCPGKDCILGTVLLHPNRLEIDYARRTVKLIPPPN